MPRATASEGIANRGFFPYGVQYHRAPTPLPQEWEGDLKEIARAGFSHIQLRPQWRWHERVHGAPTWDDMDRLFDLAHAAGLRVVLKPMLEAAPDWVYSDLGGTRIGFNGVPISPVAHGAYYVGGWWPCFDNPHVFAAAQAFVGAITHRYKDHPALWFYNAWNEPMSRPMGQCHCDHSASSYRAWLTERYGDIDGLNAAFGKAWTSMEHVKAPEGTEDYAEMHLWRTWAASSVANQVRMVVDAIRGGDPEAFIMTHTALPSVTQDPVWHTNDDILTSKEVNGYGTSFWVPWHPESVADHVKPELICSWLRRVDPAFACHEFYPNSMNWAIPPTPQTLTRLIWLAIAGGAGSFTFWQYKSERVGNEANGAGLREINGSSTPRSDAADAVAATLRDHGRHLAGTTRVPSGVALLYSRDSDLISRIAHSSHPMFRVDLEPERDHYAYKRAIWGTHAALTAAGYPPEWVVPGDDLSAVKLLVVPLAEMIDAAAAQWLQAYVAGGGSLLVEYPLAVRDERTWVTPERPALGIDALLGCREALRLNATPADTFTVCGSEPMPAASWKCALEPASGAGVAVVGRWADGAVAAVSHTLGAGTVLTVGTSLGLSWYGAQGWETPQGRVYEVAVQSAGLAPASPRSPGVLVAERRPKGGGPSVWMGLNCTQAEGWFTLPAEPTEVLQGAPYRRAGLDVKVPAGGVWVGVTS